MTRWRIAVALLLCGVGMLWWMFAQARAMPVIRTAQLAMPFPADGPQRPVRIALMTDTHMSGPDNGPQHMARVVDLVNAQKPDLILLGGDYLGERKPFGRIYTHAEQVEPFARLRAKLGVVAVLGNHDVFLGTHEATRELQDAFPAAGITLLINRAVRRGPLVIGGIDDFYHGLPDVRGTIAAMRRLGGAPVLLSHSADIFPGLDPFVPLVLAGHSHCGQMALPGIGALYVPARTGTKYACGRYDEGGRTLIVSGGIGTSALPLRLFAPPDIWVVTIVPLR